MAERSAVVSLLLALASLHSARGAMSPFLASFSSKLLAPGVSPLGASPFAMPVKDPACGDLPLGQCQLRTTKCKDIKSLAQGTSGPVKDVMDCATLLGIPKMMVIGVLPQAFGEGKPETIVDRVMPNNTEASSELRRCVMQAAGMLTLNGTLNRAALQFKLASTMMHPLVKDVVTTALTTCPDPDAYKISDFLTCVRSECIHNMPESVAAMPDWSLLAGGGDDDDDDKDKDKKCKKGKKCKKH
ncbi:uncharacterized protein LOC134769793 [Penaeus indicus]|uniref:uncharacterized protein LOC134769793 n=1 Tax=Penaeus indicus TaxID=29960 RepID=UPI00300C4046